MSDGQGLIEYALLLALVVLIIIAIYVLRPQAVQDVFANIYKSIGVY